MSDTVIIRPVRDSDAAGLQALADLLDTVNLPDDPAAIATIIKDSQRSFVGEDPRNASYTLVAVSVDDSGKETDLLGTGSLFAYHGMPDEPHYYLRVVEQTVHSKQLNADRTRHLLQLGRDIEPWTELGGLVVHPKARGKGVGKLLLASRLLMIAMHRQRFCKRLLVELLPSRREDGGNAFWDAVGAPLTGLNYYRADLLCRSDKEFIEAFFPHEEIMVELLPKEAQALIGKEGPDTTPARKLLQRVGFKYLGTVDPFDAGPHDGAEVSDVQPIQKSRQLVKLDLPPSGPTTNELLCQPEKHVFIPAVVQQQHQGVRIDNATTKAMGIAAGDSCWALPLDW